MLTAIAPTTAGMSAMHRKGMIHNPVGDIHIPEILVDSGAIHSSYISQSFVDLHLSYFGPRLKPCKHSVRLGDGKTSLRLTHTVLVPVSIIDSNGLEHTCEIECSVMAMTTTSMIIGLPDIVTGFFTLFLDMLRQAHAGVPRLNQGVFQSKDPLSSSPDINAVSQSAVSASPYDPFEGATDPWKSRDDVAIEDDGIPIPCSYTGPLNYMEQSREEAIAEYFSQFEDHISPEFLAAKPEILTLLQSQMAQEVFNPVDWTGILGIDDLDFDVSPDMPKFHKPPARPVNARLMEHATKEAERLLMYFWVLSTSSIASPLVIAPKATKPFIRLCGDYRWVNQFLTMAQRYIPNVRQALQKAAMFKYFCDLDMTNSFHQLRLSRRLSELLSVQSQWGLFRPEFLPEGVSLASGVLQEVVMSIFQDFSEWTIVIFDNFLVLASSYEDCYNKLELILKRCHERHLVLKFSKSWLAVQECTFFGYLVSQGATEMSLTRKAAIDDFPMPTSTKLMQRFLGMGNFFQPHVPCYSQLTAPLHDMTKAGFNWDPTTWTVDYVDVYSKFKAALIGAVKVYFPDYNLPWVLRTDASEIACGGVLFQVLPDGTHQPIVFCSSKFSASSLNWDVYTKEAWAIVYAIKQCEYLLRGKAFVIETDHKNLLYMENHSAPMIVRWRVFIQSFLASLRHIKGTDNFVSDWMSRMFFLSSGGLPTEGTTAMDLPPDSIIDAILCLLLGGGTSLSQEHPLSPAEPSTLICALRNDIDPAEPPTLLPTAVVTMTATDMLRLVHGDRQGHHGVVRTWEKLNKSFGDHGVSMKIVRDFITECPTCQKTRIGMAHNLPGVLRHNKVPHARSTLGVDTLTIGLDDEGYSLIIVVVEHFTKFASLYRAKSHTAIELATALFGHMVRYGYFECIASDPGSDLMSDVIRELNAMFGIQHTVSLVDRHESNGVEPTNKSILRHLRALTHDLRNQNQWSHPTILPLIENFLNHEVHSETGISPIVAKYGTLDAAYFELPASRTVNVANSEFVKSLDANIAEIRAKSFAYQQSLVAKRSSPDVQLRYNQGDHILFNQLPSATSFRPHKLAPQFLGPYRVISQYKSEVTCRNLISGAICIYHIDRVKIFVGTDEEAFSAAQRDHDQYEVSRIVAYRGTPTKRTTIELEVHFADGSVHWKPWDKDISDTVQFEAYCRSRSELFPLVFTFAVSKQHIKALKDQAITAVKPNDTVFVDLRCYGYEWYAALNLPDHDHTDYVVAYTYTKWKGATLHNGGHNRIDAWCPVFKEHWQNANALDNYFVFAWGSKKIFNAETMVLVDSAFIAQYPQVWPQPADDAIPHRNVLR